MLNAICQQESTSCHFIVLRFQNLFNDQNWCVHLFDNISLSLNFSFNTWSMIFLQNSNISSHPTSTLLKGTEASTAPWWQHGEPIIVKDLRLPTLWACSQWTASPRTHTSTGALVGAKGIIDASKIRENISSWKSAVFLSQNSQMAPLIVGVAHVAAWWCLDSDSETIRQVTSDQIPSNPFIQMYRAWRCSKAFWQLENASATHDDTTFLINHGDQKIGRDHPTPRNYPLTNDLNTFIYLFLPHVSVSPF